MKRNLRDNGLAIVMFSLYFLVFIGQILAGHAVYNDDREERHEPPIGVTQYLTSGHFVEATFENWESEFLQMGVYVVLTAFLFQRGSSESKDPDDPDKDQNEFDEKLAEEGEPDDKKQAGAEDKARKREAGAKKREDNLPEAVKRSAAVRVLHENSLSIALLSLFAVSFLLHAAGGMRVYNEEQIAHGKEVVSFFGFLGTSAFWFQSFQNWQSEFLSIGVLVVLSIYLRQKGSPESKPIGSRNHDTGD